jgi:hypothetical protein
MNRYKVPVEIYWQGKTELLEEKPVPVPEIHIDCSGIYTRPPRWQPGETSLKPLRGHSSDTCVTLYKRTNHCITFVFLITTKNVGRYSSVGKATRYGLDGPGIQTRWGTRFSASVQSGPGAHPATCTTGTGSFPRVKRQRSGVDHPPHVTSRLKKEYSYKYLLPLWAFVTCSRVTFTIIVVMTKIMN